MLRIYNKFSQLDFDKLLRVYDLYGSASYKEADDLHDYLTQDFFRNTGAFYAVWEVEGVYVSALRLERFLDGYLVEALQTVISARKRGYATVLLQSILESGQIPPSMPVYAHIQNRNIASIKVHKKCGFKKVYDYASFIDGTVSGSSSTYKWKK